MLVAFCAALFGTCFALAPILLPGLRTAWTLSAAPAALMNFFRPKAKRLPEDRDDEIVHAVSLCARIAIAVVVFYLLSWAPNASGRPYFSLYLDIVSDGVTWTSVVAWAVRLAVVALCLYYVPRAISCFAVSLYQVPRSWIVEIGRDAYRLPLERKPFAIVGALVAFLAALVAYYAPTDIVQKNVSAPLPILRDNFWLTIHVITIMASYAAGFLAWGLGNISLCYYLFGKYRTLNVGAPDSADRAADVADSTDYAPTDAAAAPVVRHAAPKECVDLAGYIYKATQVAVLLLVAGTIFGALWADVAWGRFWGWDAKEVWSLVTLLIYMAVLHARYVGWSGNFGIAVGSVFGFTSIIMTWYGVNFRFGSGLHSYASGTGGLREVVIVVVVNWIFALVAAVRYTAKMSGGKAAVSSDCDVEPDCSGS